MSSILSTVKKLLGIEENYTHYDNDITVYINSSFISLQQIGVGPPGGFSITNVDDTWEDFLGDTKELEAVKTYITLKVKLLFDPPTSSFVIESINQTLTQLEWRLNIQGEKLNAQ
jgi:hypothetical protein